MTKMVAPAFLSALVLLGGCSGASEGFLPTGSIFGGAAPAATAPSVAPQAPVSSPASRALHVGSVSARAQKCGYNFDPAKLKTAYINSEVATGAAPEDMAKVEKIYSVAMNGVMKAATLEPAYCSAAKTKKIKADLTRVLAGNFVPPAPKPLPKDEGGLFSGWGDSGGSSSKGLDIKPSTYEPF
jgi:hypothetical protein